MATINQWEEACKKLSEDELAKISDAIDVLGRWDFFNDQYAGLGMLQTIVSCEYFDKAFKQKAKT